MIIEIECRRCHGEGTVMTPVGSNVKPRDCDECGGSGERQLDILEFVNEWFTLAHDNHPDQHGSMAYEFLYELFRDPAGMPRIVDGNKVVEYIES